MARERGADSATPIEPGIVARIAAGLRYAATSGFAGKFGGRASKPSGPDAESWFGPLDPLPPMAPPNVAGRRFDYPAGYNIVTQPRSYEPVSFQQLRGLADGYDLLRLVIETRKDQIARMPWTIRARNRPRVTSDAPNPRADAIRDFLTYPDREHSWDAWLRMLLEDLLVIDALTLYARLDNAGRLYALEPIDGATIKRLIDDAGRTPVPPAPAYQQILKGLPAVDYAADELLYLPRNVRTNRIYGYSPVEQVVMTVNIALRRQLHQLQYYTEGTVPEALIGVPETWTPDQIGQFQSYWDALLTDDTATRRHARFVPATISKSFVQTKEAALKDEYDEWLARIICYAFSVSSQWAIKAMNRATAQTAAEQANEEGLAPLLVWVKGALDRILRQCFAAPDLEFHWLEEQDQDSLTQAQVDQLYLQAGVKSINEVRAEQGLAPVEGGETPLIQSGGSLVPLAQAAKGSQSAPAPLTQFAKYAPDQPRDDHGRWTDGSGVQVAAGAEEEDEREDLEPEGEINETTAIVRQAQLKSGLGLLRELDPNNPALDRISAPGHVPAQQELDDLDKAIGEASAKRVGDFVKPGGQLIGNPGGGEDVRELPGTAGDAEAAFSYLTLGGQRIDGTGYPGKLVRLPGNAGTIGFRPSTGSGSPSVEVNTSELGYMKFHFIGASP